jgi:hypothetical protein
VEEWEWRDAGDRSGEEEIDHPMTSRSYMSDESRGFRVGAAAGVESKIKALESWGQPLLNKVGALNRGHCWSCSEQPDAPTFTATDVCRSTPGAVGQASQEPRGPEYREEEMGKKKLIHRNTRSRNENSNSPNDCRKRVLCPST